MSKDHIIFNNHAREELVKGIDTLASAVKVTLGPSGRTVAIGYQHDLWPQSTKDGVTIAKKLKLTAPFQNMGAQMVRQVASKTEKNAGDGTTTATVLAQFLLHKMIEAVRQGYNPVLLNKGLEIARDQVVSFLKRSSTQVTGDFEKIEQVATISVNGDKELGNLIARAMEATGYQGGVIVEEALTANTELEETKGIKIDNGVVSPLFRDHISTTRFTLEDSLIFMTDARISSLSEIEPLLNIVMEVDRPLLIVANSFEGEALQVVITNNVKGKFKIGVINAPLYLTERTHAMEDLAILTGGKYISEARGESIKNVTLDMLGEVEKIEATQDSTVISNGAGDPEEIDQRIKDLNVMLEQEKDEHQRTLLTNRIARMCGGVAVIGVGGQTKMEVGEKRDRIADALAATKSATEEGILPGGGVSFIAASKELSNYSFPAGTDKNIIKGFEMLRSSLSAPFFQILINSGFSGPKSRSIFDRLSYWLTKQGKAEEIYKQVYEKPFRIGFDAVSGTYVNMFTAGIIDPTKVSRTALETAVSVAITVTTTECVLYMSEYVD